MNILYIDHYAGSDDYGMEFRPYYLAKEWEKHGHKVILMAGTYSHLRKRNPVITTDYSVKNHHGIDYFWLKTVAYSGNGLKRILSMLQFTLKGFLKARNIAKRFKPDVVICSSTYPFDTWAGQRIARIAKCPLLHEIHDLWPLTPMVLGGYSPNHPFIRIMKKAEDSAYKNSDGIVSILPNAVEYVREQGFETPLIHIPNGVYEVQQLLTYPPNEDIVKRVEELKSKGLFVIGYAGGMALSNALMDFLKSMEGLKGQNYAAVLVGDGVERVNLEKYCQEKGLDNIYFCGQISKHEVIPTLKEMDALFATGHKSSLYKYGLALNKLFDYMLTGKPIILAFDTEDSPLHDCGTGIHCEPENILSIVDGIQRASSLSGEEKETIAISQREYVLKFHSYEHISKQFLEFIESLGNKQK